MEKVYGGKRNQSFPVNKEINTISIIIVTRNADQDLQNCLDSITNQRYKNLEVLVFDGASTDGTLDIIRKNEEHISYWQSEPDKGIYDAMNKAIKHATGDWVYFLGADDLLLDSFSDIIESLQRKNTIYYGGCITDKGYKLDGEFSSYRLTKMNICHHAVFYPFAVFKKYAYQIQFRVYADYVLNIQCWGDSDFPKKYIPIIIAKFNSNGFSATNSDELFENKKNALIKKHLSRFVNFRIAMKKWKQKNK